MSISYDKRRLPSAKDASERSNGISSPKGLSQSVSNSAMASAMGYRDMGGEGAGLKSAMEAKAMSIIRPGRFGADYEEPRAEAEASRIGNRFSGASGVEELKSRMGEALGADFSSVRFHTGADAASMTAASDSNAFTSGRDIYLGGGGFNAATAAHEMVHTIQQGAVQASVPVMSAPAGSVQYDKKQKKEYKGHSAPVEWMLKSHHEALDQYNEHKDDYRQMTRGQRALWSIKNPLARIRGGMGQNDGTEFRKKQAEEEQRRADELAKRWKHKNGKWRRSVMHDAMPLSDSEEETNGYVAGTGQQAVSDFNDMVGSVTGDLNTDTGVLSSGTGFDVATIVSEADKMKGGSGVAKMDPAGTGMGAVAMAGDATSAVSNAMEANKDFEQGDDWAGRDASARSFADMVSTGADTVGMIPVPAAATFSSAMSATANLVRTGADTSTAIRHGRTQRNMRKRGEKNQERIAALEEKKNSGEELSKKEKRELKRRKSRAKSIEQLRKASRVHKNEAIVSATANGVRATGNIVGTGLGAAALVTTGGMLEQGANIANAAGSIGGAAVEGIGGLITKQQKKKMRKEVVDEELGLESKIDALHHGDYNQELGLTQEQAENMSRTEAKRIILRSMGFKSGKRQEAFNRITQRRASKLTRRANRDENSEEAAMMKDMYLHKGSDGKYNTAAVAERMGYEEMGDDNPFKAANEDRRRRDAAKQAAKDKEAEEKRKKKEAKAAKKKKGKSVASA